MLPPPSKSCIAPIWLLQRTRLASYSAWLVRQRLGGLLGGRGALVQGALGLLQGCIYAAQLGGDFGALPLQLIDLALGLALLVLQFFQFLLGFVVGLLGLILFCR